MAYQAERLVYSVYPLGTYIASSATGYSAGDEVFIDIILADLRVNDNLDRKLVM